MEPEDTHHDLKIVLQRQFFEAVARAAFVKYASGSDDTSLVTLSHKLDKVFNSNYKPMAVKNKSKSQEEEKQFKLADKVSLTIRNSYIRFSTTFLRRLVTSKTAEKMSQSALRTSLTHSRSNPELPTTNSLGVSCGLQTE